SAASPAATSRAVARSRVRSQIGRVRSSDTTGWRVTPSAVASTAYRPAPVGTSSTSAASAPTTPRADPLTVPPSAVKPATRPAGHGGERHRQRYDGATGERGEQLRVVHGEQRRGRHHRAAQVRHGGHRPAELLAHHRHLPPGGAAAAVPLGYGEAGQAHLGG